MSESQIFVRMLEVLVLSVGGFLAGVVGISMLRRSIVEGGLASGAEVARNTAAMIHDAKQKQEPELANRVGSDAGGASLTARGRT